MASSSQRVSFSVFAGDWLSGGGRNSENQFSGHNVHVYEDGTVGPRPGWEEMTWTNPTGTNPLKGITWAKRGSADGSLFVAVEDGTNIDLFEYTVSDGALGASIDTDVVAESIMPDPPSSWAQDWPGEKLLPTFTDHSQVVAFGSHIYEDFDVTNFPAATGGGYAAGCLIYRDRAFFWGFDNFPGRIAYSNAGDYDTIEGTFDVTPFPDQAGVGVIGCWNIRDALVLCRRDDVWLAMFGTNPNDGSLREIGHGVIPDNGVAVADMDNQLWFLKPSGQGVATVTPSGVNDEEFQMARPGREAGTETGMPVGDVVGQVAIRGLADVSGRNLMLAYLSTDTVGGTNTVWFLCRINGVWVQESFKHADTIDEVDLAIADSGRIIMVIRDSSDTYHAYSRQLVLDRPARDTGDPFTNQLTGETTPNPSIVLPEVVAPLGSQVRVRQIIVDLNYWQQTTEFDDPAITIGARLLGADTSADSDDQEIDLTGVTIDGSAWPATTGNAGSRRRVKADFDSSVYAGAFEVRLSGLVSVAVEQVTVVYDDQSSPRS